MPKFYKEEYQEYSVYEEINIELVYFYNDLYIQNGYMNNYNTKGNLLYSYPNFFTPALDKSTKEYKQNIENFVVVCKKLAYAYPEKKQEFIELTTKNLPLAEVAVALGFMFEPDNASIKEFIDTHYNSGIIYNEIIGSLKAIVESHHIFESATKDMYYVDPKVKDIAKDIQSLYTTRLANIKYTDYSYIHFDKENYTAKGFVNYYKGLNKMGMPYNEFTEYYNDQATYANYESNNKKQDNQLNYEHDNNIEYLN